MSSIIQGYEYDIFISYRQKDNKYDGWVTEFVDNLRKELEATFKDDLSIYFDINPHDGILETYNVDASLKQKLRSLIFIPIISQTYCDPRSFAWQNEFIMFNKMSKEDSVGRDINLINGNVASRILPVKIHDLDVEDTSLLENELGGALRSVDFIFKSPGVNRPLRPDDSRSDNLNHTYYRDQVNKIANAIKTIITSIKNPVQEIQSKDKFQTKPPISTRNKLVIIISILLIGIIIVGIYLISGINSSVKNNPDNSIAVLYFDNISSEPDQDYFSDGMTDEIIAHLSLIKGLRVISRTSMIQYKGKDNINIREIAKQLNVASVLEGSVRKSGNKLRITAELIDAHKDRHIWTQIYDRDLTDVFKIQSEIAHSIAEKFNIPISTEANSRIESAPTTNIKAYDLYLKAKAIPRSVGFGIGTYRGGEETAVRLLKEAILLDPDFSQAYALWSQIYIDPTYSQLDSAISLAKTAIERHPKLPDGYIALAEAQDFANAIQTLAKLCDIDSTRGLLGMGNKYSSNADFPEAFQFYKRVINLDPNLYESYLGIARIYYFMAQHDSVDKYIGLAGMLAPNSIDIIEFSLARVQFSGNPDLVIAAAKNYYGDDTLNFSYVTGISYLFAGDWKNAERYYSKSNYRDMDWGLVKIKTGSIDSGVKILKQALSYRGSNGWAGDISRINAVLGNKIVAISEFKRLIGTGWHDLVWMRNDPYWDELREEIQFKKIMDEVETRNVKMLQQISENNYSAVKLKL